MRCFSLYQIFSHPKCADPRAKEKNKACSRECLVLPLRLGLVSVLGEHDLAPLLPLLDAALLARRLARRSGGLASVDVHSCYLTSSNTSTTVVGGRTRVRLDYVHRLVVGARGLGRGG